MMVCDLEKQAHETVRVWHHLGRMDGYSFNKKIMRFNEMVEVAFRYGRCGQDFSIDAFFGGLREALHSTSPEFPEMYEPGLALTSLCPEWMCATSDPRGKA